MKLLILVISALAALAQVKDTSPRYLGTYTVATLPAAASWSGYVAVVTDASTAGSCTVGGGSALSLCRSSGSAWASLGGGGTTYTAGATGALTISGSVIDVDTAYVPNKTGSNTWTGVNDASGATRTAPMKVGTSDPGTCTVGDFLFRSDTGTTKACTATNTWTAVGSGGGTVRTTYASLPSCGSSNTNYQYVLTDSIYSANCNGSSYAYWSGQKYIPTLPWSNGTAYSTGATVTATTGSVLFDGGTPAGTDALRGYVKAVPSAPYTIILDMDHYSAGSATSYCGMFLTTGTAIGSTSAIAFTVGNAALSLTKYTSNSTFSASYFSYTVAQSRGKISLKMVDDNANRTWSISQDRINWTQVSQQARTDFLTATHYGYGCNMTGSGGIVTMTVEGLYAQ